MSYIKCKDTSTSENIVNYESGIFIDAPGTFIASISYNIYMIHV